MAFPSLRGPACLGAVLVFASLAGTVAAQTVRPLAVDAAAAVAALRAEHRIPGISVAVLHPDGAVTAEGFGLADVENDVPVTPATVFRLASISKPVTAVIAMRLAARGELDLDRPVHEFVPEFPEKRWPVTTRQLLAHLGGVRHYAGPLEMRSNLPYRSVVSALEIFADDPLLHEPGTAYRYTTFGYNLVGGACARAGGRRFRELFETEIVGLVGCVGLQFDDQQRIIRHRAQGYRLDGDELVNSAPVDTSNKVPGGGLCADATSLVRFAGAVCDGTLLDAASRDAMWTEQRTTDGKGVGYGLGWSILKGDVPRRVAHGGAQPRVSTFLWLAPDEGVAVAVLCNLEGQGGPIRALAEQLGSAALR